MKTIAFFNNKGGVGKTSLVYHLAWIFSECGLPVLAVDLDPQANLTSMFLEEDKLEELWPEDPDAPGATAYGAVRPIIKGLGDVVPPEPAAIAPNLELIPGDLRLSSFEEKLSDSWPRCHNRDESAFRVTTAFHRMMAPRGDKAELVLIDVGPNLGAGNRAALIASDTVCIPLAPDLFSLRGLRNLGPTLREWRTQWGDMLVKKPSGLAVPTGSMKPMGYIVMQHGMRDSRPVQAYQRWMNRIPRTYREAVLEESSPTGEPSVVTADPHCLALLRHYRSLMPLAMEARKPMFHLKPADGAMGAHVAAVRDCRADFLALARRIAAGAGVVMP